MPFALHFRDKQCPLLMPQHVLKPLRFHASSLEGRDLAGGKTAELLSSRGSVIAVFRPVFTIPTVLRFATTRYYVMAYSNTKPMAQYAQKTMQYVSKQGIVRARDIEAIGIPREHPPVR